MFRPIEDYRESGKRAAKAQNENDASRVKSEQDYFRRMLEMESGQDKIDARFAFDFAYKATRNVRRIA